MPEMVVKTDDHFFGVQFIYQNIPDEIDGRDLGKFEGEVDDDQMIQSGFTKQFNFFSLRIDEQQVFAGRIGIKNFARVRVKGNEHGFTPDFAGKVFKTV